MIFGKIFFSFLCNLILIKFLHTEKPSSKNIEKFFFVVILIQILKIGNKKEKEKLLAKDRYTFNENY